MHELLYFLNYGFDDTAAGWENGTGGESALENASGNLEAFNVEQQANIIEHYYVRRYVENMDPGLYEAWQPYADIVHS